MGGQKKSGALRPARCALCLLRLGCFPFCRAGRVASRVSYAPFAWCWLPAGPVRSSRRSFENLPACMAHLSGRVSFRPISPTSCFVYLPFRKQYGERGAIPQAVFLDLFSMVRAIFKMGHKKRAGHHTPLDVLSVSSGREKFPFGRARRIAARFGCQRFEVLPDRLTVRLGERRYCTCNT